MLSACLCTVFSHLAEAGIAVYAFDAHGHGLSEPKDEKLRCYFEHFEDLTDDSWQFIRDVVAPKSIGLPIFCGGHSLGGLVAAYVVASHQSVFTGLVLNSAAIDVVWTPLLKCACHSTATSRLIPHGLLGQNANITISCMQHHTSRPHT